MEIDTLIRIQISVVNRTLEDYYNGKWNSLHSEYQGLRFQITEDEARALWHKLGQELKQKKGEVK